MTGSFRVLRAKLVRICASRSAWLGLALVALIPALRVWAAVLAQRAKEIERMAGGGSAPGLSEGNGWALLVDGWRAGLMLATALLLVQSARALAGDRETGVFRLAVTRSASRSGAVVGRALMGPVVTLAMVLVAGGGALLAATALGADFGDLVEDDYTIFSALEVREELHYALVGAFLAMIAVHGFGLLVSSASRGPVLALAGSLATILLWDVFKEDLGDARWFVFASHAPTFADGSGMREMASFARGMSDAGHPEAVHNMGLVLSPAAWVVSVVLACLALRRRPI